jgi:hypothetical protein
VLSRNRRQVRCGIADSLDTRLLIITPMKQTVS